MLVILHTQFSEKKMNLQTVIRKAVIEDYDAIYALWMSCRNMGFNSVDDSREGIARLLERNPETCFVAETDGAITGTVFAGSDGRRGYIYHACVAEAHRHQGIGKALVSATLDALKAICISKVALVVFARNEDGNAFWEKMGFTKRDDLFYRNIALVEMERIDT